MEAAELPAVPLRKKKFRRRRKLRPERKLTGSRLDETYSLVRRALVALDQAAGESGRWDTEEAYDHLYAAEDIIGKALKKPTR